MFSRRVGGLVALVALVLVVAGAIAFSSNGSHRGRLLATGLENCPPVARDDAAFTRPDEPVAIDVLANDTDVNRDPLRLGIVDVSAGTAVVDNGATPANPRDDKVRYTPASGATEPTAIITYRIEDPAGDISTAEATVAVNDAGALPEGLRSASNKDPGSEVVELRCVSQDDSKDATDEGTAAVQSDPGPPSGEQTVSVFSSFDGAATKKSGAKSGSGQPDTSTTERTRHTTTTHEKFNDSPTPQPSTPGTTSPTPRTTSPPSGNNEPPPCYDGPSCRDYANGGHPTTTTTPPAP